MKPAKSNPKLINIFGFKCSAFDHFFFLKETWKDLTEGNIRN